MAGDQRVADAKSTSDRQRVRDETDNEAIRQAWQTLVGSLPDAAADRVSRGEVFYSALDLAEHLIAPSELSGWRISLTSEGGPYSATLILCNPESGIVSEISASDPESLTLALLCAINLWAKGRAKPPAARNTTIAERR
jgi:hypothetical protein